MQENETNFSNPSRIKQSYIGRHRLKVFGFLFTIFSMALVVIIADLTSTYLTTGSFSIIPNNKCILQEKNYYAIQLNSFKTKEDAITFSKSVQSRGGAGYIYKDNEYLVFASMYNNLEKANEVCDNLKSSGESAPIFEFKVNKIEYNINLKNSDKDCLSNAINLFDETFNDLFQMITELDTGNTTFSQTNLNLNSLYGNLENKESSFEKSFSLSTNTQILILKSKLGLLINSVNSMIDPSITKDQLSYLLKLNSINIVYYRSTLK
jgi:hypothetical protein